MLGNTFFCALHIIYFGIFQQRTAAYDLLQCYIGMLNNHADLPIERTDLSSNIRHIPPAYFEEPNDTKGLDRIKAIVVTAVRDTTDRNLTGKRPKVITFNSQIKLMVELSLCYIKIKNIFNFLRSFEANRRECSPHD